MSEAIELTAPAWATERNEIEAAISWERTETVEILPTSTDPDAPAGTLDIGVLMSDTIVITEQRVTLVRDSQPRMYVGDGDELMTVTQARKLAATILSVADAVEGVSS